MARHRRTDRVLRLRGADITRKRVGVWDTLVHSGETSGGVGGDAGCVILRYALGPVTVAHPLAVYLQWAEQRLAMFSSVWPREREIRPSRSPLYTTCHK